MDLLQLKYFQMVARTEHMTQAARELQIAQPALSMTIARLEEDLGVPLFDRKKRRIVLNKYGNAFLKKVNLALTTLDEGLREITDLAGLEHGCLSIASTILNRRFCDFLGSFITVYPNINFRISQISNDETKVQLLEAGEVDFCFISTMIACPNLAYIPLKTEEFVLAVKPDHRLASRHTINLWEVANDPFISLKADHSLRKFCDELCKRAGFTPNIICECDEPAAIGNLVNAGLGVALLSATAIKEQSPSLISLTIKDQCCNRTLQLAWNEKRYFSKAALQFREYVIQHFAG